MGLDSLTPGRRSTGSSAYARARHRLGEQGPLFWVALVVLVVLPLTWTGVRTGQTLWRLHRAEVELRDALPDAVRRSTDERARLRALMADAGRTEREHAWRELVCEVRAEGTVWIADDHVQVCEVRMVDVYRAEPTVRRGCLDSEVLPRPRPDWLWGLDVHERHEVAMSTYDFDVGCPQLLDVEDFMEDERTSRLVDGDPPSGEGEWLVTVHSTPVSQTSIGCHPWVPVFCLPPGRPRL